MEVRESGIVPDFLFWINKIGNSNDAVSLYAQHGPPKPPSPPYRSCSPPLGVVRTTADFRASRRRPIFT
jgi:hypothetical protein